MFVEKVEGVEKYFECAHVQIDFFILFLSISDGSFCPLN